MINYDSSIQDFSAYPGYHIILLDELARRAGFHWRHSWGVAYPATINDSFRLKPNATTEDLLLWTVNAYDISVTAWDHTLERLKMGISFPGSFSDTSTVLIGIDSKQETTSFDPFSFFKPFDWVVWLSTILTILCTALIYRWVQYLYDTDQSTNNAGVHIFRASMAALGQVMFEPRRPGERILVFSISFWSLIIVATYTANLAGFLIAERQPVYPALSLAEAERKGVAICTPANWSIATKTEDMYPKGNFIEVDYNSRYDHLLKKDCSLVLDGYDNFRIAERNESYPCSLDWVGRVEQISNGGPATIVDTGEYCTSLVSHVIEFYLSEMYQDGFIANAYEKFLDSVSTYQCPVEESNYFDDSDEYRLTMKDMGGIFLWHFVTVLIALLVAVGNHFWAKRMENQKNDEEEVRSANEMSCMIDS